MDKRKFVRQLFGDLPPEKEKLYIKNTDNAISTLPYRNQLVVRLKFSKVPFTKMSRLVPKEYGVGRASPKEASRVFHYTLFLLSHYRIYTRIFEGEVFGDISTMVYNNEEKI